MKLIGFLLVGLVVYLGLVLEVIRKPLTIGYIRDAYSLKQNYAAGLGDRPKVVVVGGSSSLFSVRCQVIERVLNRPCVNMAVTAGIGIDLMLTKAMRVINSGDVVILPLEYDFYATRSEDLRANATANAYLVGYDHPLLFAQDWKRQLAALFSVSLPDFYSSAVEMGLAQTGFQRRFRLDQLTQQGDMSGHTPDLATAYVDYIGTLPGQVPQVFVDSAGATLIAQFIKAVQTKGARVYGTDPASIDDGSPAGAGFDQVEAFWLQAGAGFIRLSNAGRHPRQEFFDTGYHLAEPYQIAHTEGMAAALKTLLE
jgi:hypothetical protein